jgi:saccharopine dehydrogenase-like NADP-dependent oxidoreductase
MAFDLAKNGEFEVTVVDRDQACLDKIVEEHPEVNVLQEDLSNPETVSQLVRPFDLVVNSVPGFMGYETAKAIIKAGKNSVCIAFYEEDPFSLDQLARDHDVSMIMDCGVYPGMGSALIMHAAQQLDSVDTVLTYVGGLPEIREWPSQYKALFSPVDVIEEYIRPARYKENGFDVVRPALSDPEFISFPGIGTLEAFNTDGLRTLAKTLDAPNMKEKTLRYPGHIEAMAILRELGFFNKEKILEFEGVKVSPMDLTGKVLFPAWQLQKGEPDIMIFESSVKGMKDGEPKAFTIKLYDRYCPETDVISMARTTGYTATVALRMLANGTYAHKGISPPEYIGQDPECVTFMLDHLNDKGVHWEFQAA